MSRPSSAKNSAYSLVQPCLLSFNRIKLTIKQLCFKFNCTCCHINTLPCLHATCRRYHSQRCLFTDSRACTQTRCLPNIRCLPWNGFSYKDSTPVSAVQPYLHLAAEILISCRIPGSAERTQIAIPSRKAVTSATLNPLPTLTNSLIAFCNTKQAWRESNATQLPTPL